jgi:hypothetical protein
MNTTRITPPQPNDWLEDKLAAGSLELRRKRDELRAAIEARPLCAVAAGIGFGYLARTLPLVTITASLARLSLGFLPHALLVIGAKRAWDLLQPDLRSPAVRRPATVGRDTAEDRSRRIERT